MSNTQPTQAFPEPEGQPPVAPIAPQPVYAQPAPPAAADSSYPGQYPPANGQPPVYGAPPVARPAHRGPSKRPSWLRALFEVIGAVLIALIFLLIGIGVGHHGSSTGSNYRGGVGNYQHFNRQGFGTGSGTSGQSGTGSTGQNGFGNRYGSGTGTGSTNGQSGTGTGSTPVTPTPQATTPSTM